MDAQEARVELGIWFQKMLEELEEDHVDPTAVELLKGRIAKAFADWRIETGYGMAGPGTGPNS